MIVLFTDYSSADIYIGQIKSRLMQFAPSVGVVDLFHDVPNYSISCGSHLLAALLPQFTLGSVFLCVVDPGVERSRYRGENSPINLIKYHNSSSPRKGFFCTLP